MGEAGVQTLYHSLITGVTRQGSAVTGIEVTHKAGREELRAAVVIDSSGDADVAWRAGAPVECGRESDGRVQPVSLMFKVDHVDNAALRAYTAAHPAEARLNDRQLAAYMAQPLNKNHGFCEKIKAAVAAGRIPVQRGDILFFNTNHEDEMIINTSRIMGVDPLDPWSLSEAENLGREQVFALLDFFRKEIPGFASARLVAVGARLGIRESRRIRGEYVLTGQDILAQRRFPDDVMTCAYPVDIHSLKPGENSAAGFPYHGETYGIPYRCLVPLEVEQLLVAGRCISVTREAQGSMRTSPTVMALGQAAGTAAALAVRHGCTPRRIDTTELRRVLSDQGALL